MKKKDSKSTLNKRNSKNYSFAIGTINITNYGYAFVKIKDYKKDIFIPKNKINKSLEGDLVKIKFKKNKKIKIKGEVIKIIYRKKKKFVGIIKIYSKSEYLNNKYYNINFYKNYKSFTICNNNTIILIPLNESKKCNHNDKVLVEIISWPKNFKNPIGKIIKIFGKIGNYKAEIYSLLEEYEISYKFSKQSKNEAKKIFSKKVIINYEKINNRKDIRNINTFTIDPKDAKDFDDAISVRQIDKFIWEIGIHISDVTHYIKENSIIDKEAYLRNTSIYFNGKVIPMLPKILSNDLCSLQPKEDKLSFSFIFSMNKNGDILKSWIGKTIIQSNKRFTYDEVQKIIDQKKGIFYNEIKTLHTLSKKMEKNRLKNGSIFLDKVEVKFHLDNKKNPISLYLEKNNDAHCLIEEFMLLTNKKISEFVSINSNGKLSNKTYIYRIHDKPDNEKILYLKKIIKPLGYFLDLKNVKNSINKILLKIKGKPEQNMIENLILRSMSKAKYSTNNIGHYGLSFIHYTHFTSPIRRYSDIIAHRLLYNYLFKNKKIKSVDFYEKQLQYCSNKERIVTDIEREFLKFIQVKFLKKFLGKEFVVIITGFTDWSIYVDLILFHVEGMIKLCDIKEDNYILNPNGYSIIGKNKKNICCLGDKIKVKLIDINMEKKRVILDWIKKITI
ncbi:ribonuclease R family protein [Blattabacterium cuenoti]|uniref:ribonuclease R family protein n=1 Tax=Blattabacterium cuenoti TaxID=1653831 RepID=UPI00163CAE2A|nr:VacB/RNase II family 3'-5' exoribonuclease [Blattabacterium cuenoti]